jgi:type III restriction enzyme
MQIQFEADQDYQLAAINAIADLFDGQPYTENTLQLLETGGFALIANQLDLTESDILRNLQTIQQENKIQLDSNLKNIEAKIETDDGETTIRFPNFSIDMETGTGKTYVYIRTGLELARRYGLHKFLIVVPSVAIREGVLKTFKITEQHFKQLFSNLPYRYTVYDSSNLSRLRQFADSSTVEFLIITIDSFNKDANVIRQKDRDEMRGIPPLFLLQATRPILILDEPQNFKTEAREQALASLNPLFALRYSATHPKGKEFNRVYRLSPYEAYRRRLVKRIEVAGVQQLGSISPVFMRLEAVATAKRTLTAKIALHVLNKKGIIQEKVVTLKANDGRSFDNITNLPDYHDYVIDHISISDETVTFTNEVVLRKDEATGTDKEAIFESQIRYTIEEHFRKQARLKQHGIKVLSLFFIDRVPNYAQEEGIIRRLFRRAFDQIKVRYDEWRELDAETVQGAYFAQRRTKAGDIEFEESKTGESEKDKEAYDLIMRDKETLLTFSSPEDDEETRRKRQVCFIFSHSALREGWDNPNIFQICTLNQSVSDMKKRQEIGRGVRLAVNQQGERVRDDRLNILTVVANQSYEDYVQNLQREVAEAYGADNAPPQPRNASERSVARLNPNIYELSPEFHDLWERIKHKTRYAVKIDSENLLFNVVDELNKTTIAPPRVQIATSLIDVQVDDQYRALATGIPRTVSRHSARDASYNLVEAMLHMLQFMNPPVRITRQSLLQMLLRLSAPRRQEAMNNPQEFASLAVRTIRTNLADQLVDGIKYEKINEWYEMTRFDPEIESWREYLVPAERSVYDHVIVESDPERRFVEDLEIKYSQIVKAYVKLPSWFVVPTPVGNYNPDWAIVVEEGQDNAERLYLVSETKSTTNLDELRPDEARKIKCGAKHFQDALGVTYRHVTSVEELFESI